MPEDGGLIGQALIGLKPMNAWVHTYTKPQTSSTRSRGLGWRIHESVEDTKLSTNKQHTLSLFAFALFRSSRLVSIEGDRRLEGSSAQHANVYLIHVWDMRRTYIGYAYVVYVWTGRIRMEYRS